MLREQEKINTLVTHHLPFREFEQGFELLHAGEAVKVVLEV
jgi:Zn-dependent alcohol dehydrogenase